jgi:transforming growth factor-beta-induced protein
MRFASNSIRLTFAVLGLSAMAACSDDPVKNTPSTPDPVADTGPVTQPDAGPKPDATPVPELKDVVDTAVANGSFKILAGLLTDAGLAATLKGTGPFTVLAPTDAAFNALEAKVPGILATLKGNLPLLRRVLTYHVLNGAKFFAKDLGQFNGKSIFGGNLENLKVVATASEVKFNDSKVIIADVEATNGVIHAIDAVLVPATVVELLKGTAGKDVVATAVADGKFTILAAALTKCGLVPALQADGPFTVFAPSDTAFGKLNLTADSFNNCTDAQKAILLYHVVSPQTVGSAAIVLALNGKTLETLSGKAGGTPGALLTVKVAGSSVSLTDISGKDVNVVATDVATKNGLIHVIDSVLIPTKAN